MQSRFDIPTPTDKKRPRLRPWRDPAASARRVQVEQDLVNVRWVLGAAATLYLLFSRNVQYPLLGWATVLTGLLINGGIAYLLRRRSFSPACTAIAQGVDTVLLQFYLAALNGGMQRHMPLYTTLIVVATIRFGAAGTAISGIGGVLLWAAAGLLSGPGDPAGARTSTVLAAILSDTLLLVYFARLIRRQELSHRQSEQGLRERMYDLMVLHEISSTVHDLRSEDALQNIVEITTKVMGFQRAALFLTDNVGEMARHRYDSRSLEAQKKNLPDMFIDPRLLEAILKKKGVIVVDGSQGMPDMEHGPLLQIALPLHGQQGPIGALVVDRDDRGTVSQPDKEMLQSLAKSAVMAIENASLHRQIKHIASHDGVTDLFNHRYFQETLREQIQEAQRRWPITLLMIEIDKFKQYNDAFGHRQGDTVLFSLARALEISAEPWNGLVARYGGDEFVMILPYVGRERSLQIAHQVHERCCSLTEEMLRKHNLPTITLSVGAATYPDDAQTAGTLIDAADQAMYVVKRNGGNQIHVFS